MNAKEVERMQPKVEHSPLAWKRQETTAGIDILDKDGRFLAIVSFDAGVTVAKVNAGLIVRAVNCHDELVAALEEWLTVEYLDENGEECSAAEYWPKGYAQGMAALAKAKGNP